MRRILAGTAFLALFFAATAAVASPTEPVAPLSVTLEQRLAVAEPADWLDVIVGFESWAARDLAAIEGLGAHIAYELASIPTVFVWAQPADIRALQTLEGVTLVENNDPIEYDMDTAIAAGNVAPLWAVESPSVTIDGVKVDGKGITVAVVDTGVNAAHDDIKFRAKTVRNMMAVTLPPDPTKPSDPFTGSVLRFEDMENSDGGGHGSHVAGIVAGDGKISGGKFRGSAPGASLVGLGSQNANFWYAVAAWDWVYQNHDKVTPPIRIITNSWGYATGVPCDPAISLTKVQKKLVLEANVAMFFSAGNTGGDGTRDSTRTQFKCPWEGNIGVANYFDQNTGTKEGFASNSTSRGKRDDVATWPDISAPGTQITATNGYPATSGPASYLVGCMLLRNAGQTTGCYATLSGTSMATPFTAGVGALVLQARPDLKPADLEYILEQTAHKYERSVVDNDNGEYFADPALDYRNHGSHFYKGHGLVDAEAAVAFALTYDGTKTPVVYGEKEDPADKVGVARAKSVAASESPESTPGVGFLLAVAAIGALAYQRRRE